jgi:hypothetical protein
VVLQPQRLPELRVLWGAAPRGPLRFERWWSDLLWQWLVRAYRWCGVFFTIMLGAIITADLTPDASATDVRAWLWACLRLLVLVLQFLWLGVAVHGGVLVRRLSDELDGIEPRGWSVCLSGALIAGLGLLLSTWLLLAWLGL